MKHRHKESFSIRWTLRTTVDLLLLHNRPQNSFSQLIDTLCFCVSTLNCFSDTNTIVAFGKTGPQSVPGQANVGSFCFISFLKRCSVSCLISSLSYQTTHAPSTMSISGLDWSLSMAVLHQFISTLREVRIVPRITCKSSWSRIYHTNHTGSDNTRWTCSYTWLYYIPPLWPCRAHNTSNDTHPCYQSSYHKLGP